MKIYLDYQIWDQINKNSKLKTYFQSIPDWHYLISVAHIEEIYRARKNESSDKHGVTDMLENTIKELSDNGVITPTAEAGLKFIPKSYEDTYKRIADYDTIDIVNKFSQEKRIHDQEKYDARTLFEGKPHTKENEYKLVWEIGRVQKEIDNLNKCLLPILNCVTFSEDQIAEIFKIYGKSDGEKIIKEFPSKSVVKIEPLIYNQIRDNYFKLEFAIDRLFSILNTCGFYRDKKRKQPIREPMKSNMPYVQLYVMYL